MDVASGYGEQDVGVASGSGWNLWVWRQISSYYLSLFLFVSVIFKCFSFFFQYFFLIKFYVLNIFFARCKPTWSTSYGRPTAAI